MPLNLEEQEYLLGKMSLVETMMYVFYLSYTKVFQLSVNVGVRKHIIARYIENKLKKTVELIPVPFV